LAVVRAIGLMSGTSLDGVDVALIETDGERIARFGPSGYRPYSDAEQALLRQALAQGVGLTDRAARPGVLAEADAFVTRVHAETVEALLDTEHIDKSDVVIVGFHGQTALHRPAARRGDTIGADRRVGRAHRAASAGAATRMDRGGRRRTQSDLDADVGRRLQPASVETADAVGWSSQSIEAQAFAYLAVRTLNGMPITFPATTGVAKPMPGGVIARP